VYADVDADSLLLSPATLDAALRRLPIAPKALVVTHLYGAMVDMPAILPIAERHGIAVIEDCAQSLGATIDGRKAGSFGRIATTSFYPTKNLGALGDGGAVVTNDPELALSVARMRQYGWVSKYRIGLDHGRNSRLDEMQAAILRVKLPLLDGLNNRRREIHTRYEAAGATVNSSSETFIAHLAVLRSPERDSARELLKESGVTTDVHYPLPDHLQAFPTNRPAPVSLPATERAAEEIYSIPMFPELTDDEVSRVCEALATVASHG
jgi:dTDP-4-amino-4,6-dideoxygalactose transaminase